MPKLVNIGSLCIDNVYRVPGIATAGETVACARRDVFAGGKGLNQSIAAARAGAEVAHVGCIGADGLWLRDALAAEGVDVAAVRVASDASVASGHAVIQVNAAGENAIVIAGGANRTLTADDARAAAALAVPGDYLLLQNEVNDIPSILQAASERGCRLAFNVAPVDGREADYDLSGVGLLIVNEIEAAALAGARAPQDALDSLRRRHPHADIVLTLGRDGLLHARGGAVRALPACAVRAVDETGAGDAFIGFLLAALLAGEAMPAALRLAAAAGALATTRPGAADSIPRLAEARALATRTG